MDQRIVRAQALLVVTMAVLVLRLAQLQLVRGAHFRRLADDNRLRLVPEQAPRGLILDRKGRLVASNTTVFRVTLVPQELEDLAEVLDAVSAVVHRPSEELRRTFTRARSFMFTPATVMAQVPKEAALQLEEARWRLPGLWIQPDTVRAYPLGSTLAHLLGYLSQPTAEELPVLKQYGVRPKHLVGRIGLEWLLDASLRGHPGGLMVEVNNRGRQVRVIGRREPQAGAQIDLTVDANLQSLIEQSFGPQAGAAVVLDPRTGEVLAMVSNPAFSPEAFTTAQARAVRQFLNDPSAPMRDRATAGYQPGSIVKLIVAAAALEHHVITPQSTVVCPGVLRIGDRDFHCWNRDGHGPVALVEALTQSCNVYFMQVGRRLGATRLRAAFEEAGFSRPTGWPLPEQRGRLPQRRLTEGEVALLAIGQGEILVTPLQAAGMASLFASDGGRSEPWVVSAIDGHRVAPERVHRRLLWSAGTINAVRAGMREIVRNPNGTGHRAFSSAVTIAGKTGTAQTHVPGHTHAWFVGFCPVDQPKAAMAIVAEYGGAGGDLPAELARVVCEYVSLPETQSAGDPVDDADGERL